MGGAILRLGIAQKVVAHDAYGLKALAQLEIDDRVLQFLVDDGGNIILRVGIVFRVAGIAGHAPAEDDAFQLQPLAEILPYPVEALADAQAAIIRVHHHIHAVEHVAIGIVPGGVADTGNLVPGMRLQGDVAGDHESCTIADNTAFIFGHELAVREAVDMTEDLALPIAHAGPVDAF